MDDKTPEKKEKIEINMDDLPLVFFQNSKSVIYKLFYSIFKETMPKNNCFLRNMCATIFWGTMNPCIMNLEENFEMNVYRPKEKEAIYKMNDEFTNAETLGEIEECIKKAKRKKINVRDEYIAIFYFVKDLIKMEETFRTACKNTQPLLASAIQAMASLCFLARLECSLEHQKIISKNFNDHNKKKETEYKVKLSDFQFYIEEIESRWHPKEQKHKISCERASEFVLKKYKDIEGFKKFFLDYYQIDCTDQKNRSKCINIMAELAKGYRKEILSKHSDYPNKPIHRRSRSAKSREPKEGQDKAINRKKAQKDQNVADDQKPEKNTNDER